MLADYSFGTVFVLYNPFGDDVMKGVLERIQLSVNQRPRHVRLAYVNPVCERIFDESNWLRRVDERLFMGSSARVCYYESVVNHTDIFRDKR
jgi:hypothetical protein